MNLCNKMIVTIASFVAVGMAQGDEKSSTDANVHLKVGDPAPSLAAAQWVKGEPIRRFEKGHIYVVDFGGIGCPACMKGWTIFNGLAGKYAGKVTFAVIMTGHEDISKTKKYVERMADRMSYPVAHDPRVPGDAGEDHWVLDDLWVKSAKRPGRGYPAVFVVDKEGRIASIDVHTDAIEQEIESLLGGASDLDARQNRAWRDARYEEFYRKRQEKKYEEALVVIDDLIARFPEDSDMKYLKFGVLLEHAEDKAYAYGREVLRTYPWDKYNNAWDLCKLWSNDILNGSLRGDLQRPDYDLAIDMSMKAAELCLDDDLISFSYANAAELFFMKGDPIKGEELMLKAITTKEQESFRPLLEGLKKRYSRSR